MKRKAVSGIMLTLLMIGVLILTFNSAVARVDETAAESEFSEEPLATYSYSSASSVPVAVQWNQTYGGANVDEAHSVVQTSDAGYAIAGYYIATGSWPFRDFRLIKTNSTGNTQWSRTYGGTWDDLAYSVIQTSDEGYAITGYTESYGAGISDFWLVKTNSTGNTQWSRTYGGTGHEEAYSVVQTSDGGYAIAGYTESYGAGAWDFWLIKTDAAGFPQWAPRTYGGLSLDVAFSVIQTSDGGYAMAGYTSSFGAGGVDFWLVKTDAAGNMQWSQTYGGAYADYAFSMVQTSDGGYAIAGYTESYGAGGFDFWLVKTNSTGNMEWSRTYGGANYDVAFSVIQTCDEGYVIAGRTGSFGAGAWDFWLVKTNSTGNMEWNQTYGGTSNDVAFSVIEASGGAYAVAGYTESYGAGGSDFWLIKLAWSVPFNIGDVFAGVGNGKIRRFDSNGNSLQCLDTTSGSREETGMAFDGAGNLYTTDFTVNNMSKFDNMGNLLVHPWGGPFNRYPESVVVDWVGNVYVGEAYWPGHRLLKFDPAGRLLATFNPAIENQGIDWIDLAADQSTMFYTSEGNHIKRFDVSSNTQLPNFTKLPTTDPTFALRIRLNGEVLVAATSAVHRLDAAGNVIQNYTTASVGETSIFFALSLDPDGTSFWTGGYTSGNIYKIDIATGNLLKSFNAGILGPALGGLAIFGDINVARIPPPMFWKANFTDYAPSGMPDFDQKQDAWWPAWLPSFNWSWGAPVAVANSLWWYDSNYENNTIPPPTAIDNFTLVTAYGPWDDHNPQNVQPLVEHLAYLMDTDGQRTGILDPTTKVEDIETGLAQYLSWTGVNPQGDVNGDGIVDQTDYNLALAANGSTPGQASWNMAADIWPVTTGWPAQLLADNIVDNNDLNLVTANMNKTGMFYEITVSMPDFYFIAEEVERSEDVVLTLGFYIEVGPGEYNRIEEPYPYGHAVTVAGVNSITLQIAISDPAIDAFELGLTPGRSPVPHTHLPPEPPYITHNNASLVSHDIYNVTFNAVAGMWELVGYPQLGPGIWHVLIENAVITSPLEIHDVAITSLDLEKIVVSQNYTMSINVTVVNEGGFTETFNVTTYYDPSVSEGFANYAEFGPRRQTIDVRLGDIVLVAPGTLIETKAVTLSSGNSTTITFTWNTTGVARGNYTISAVADTVPGETDTADNTYINGIVTVTIPGDTDGDGDVDYDDLIVLAGAYGTSIGDPAYDESADFDSDGDVDYDDLILLAGNYGVTVPG